LGKGKLQTTFSLELLMGSWPSSTGMIPWWSPTKIVEMVLIGYISWSQGQKLGFQNAIFKKLFVWNYKAQSIHTCYIASSRGPLPTLFKLCPWGQNWTLPRCHTFKLNYARKTTSSNYFLSWTTYGNLTKLSRNDPWSPTKIVEMILIGCQKECSTYALSIKWGPVWGHIWFI